MLGESSARVAPPIGGAGEQAGSHTERQNVALRANQCSTFSLAPPRISLALTHQIEKAQRAVMDASLPAGTPANDWMSDPSAEFFLPIATCAMQ